MVSGRISFIGAGPGAADLMTVRGANRIAEADIVVWAASLVTPECVRDYARADAELVDSSRMTHEHALEIYRRAEREKLNVARVHSGDPSLWGAVQEQYDACDRMNVEVEIVPGVAAFSAAAASVGRELTVPEVAQSLVLTRLEGGKTPMPDGERVREFAKHGTTMALFLSAARTGQLVNELLAGGYSDDTPVLVAYKVTWPDELLLRTTLGELERTVKDHKLWRHTLFLVGEGLTAGGTRSHLYHAGHFHTYRRADPGARRSLRAKRRTERQGERADTARPSAVSTAETGGTTETGAETSTSRDIPGQSTSAGSAVETEAATAPAGSAEPPAVDPNIAWWAVREWQQDARTGSGRGQPRATGASRARADNGQSQLFATAAPAETSEPTTEESDTEGRVDERASAVTDSAPDTAAVATAQVPEPPNSVAPAPADSAASSGEGSDVRSADTETDSTDAVSPAEPAAESVATGSAATESAGSEDMGVTGSASGTAAKAQSGQNGGAKQTRATKSSKSTKSNTTGKNAKRRSGATRTTSNEQRDAPDEQQ